MSEPNKNVPISATAPLLADYLLADKPGCVVLIDSQELDLHWPASSDDAPLMIVTESLAQAEAAIAGMHNDPAPAPAPAPAPEAVSESRVGLLNLAGLDADLEPQLGRAVRLFPDRLIVYTRSTRLADTALFAFGFRKLDVVGLSSSDAATRWFEYRLSHYKQAPNWLNARFWANPERFDADDDADNYDDSDEEE